MEEPADPTTNSHLMTRSSTIPVSTIMNDASEGIIDATSARKYLDDMQFCIPGEDMTPEHLSHTLSYISKKAATPTLCSMIWATAFLTTTLTVSLIIASIQHFLCFETAKSAALNSPLQNEDLKEITIKLNTTICQWSSQQESMLRTLDKVPQIDDPANLILLDTWIQNISEGMASIQVMMEELRTQMPTRPTSPNNHPHSYHHAATSRQQSRAPVPWSQNLLILGVCAPLITLCDAFLVITSAVSFQG